MPRVRLNKENFLIYKYFINRWVKVHSNMLGYWIS